MFETHQDHSQWQFCTIESHYNKVYLNVVTGTFFSVTSVSLECLFIFLNKHKQSKRSQNPLLTQKTLVPPPTLTCTLQDLCGWDTNSRTWSLYPFFFNEKTQSVTMAMPKKIFKIWLDISFIHMASGFKRISKLFFEFSFANSSLND